MSIAALIISIIALILVFGCASKPDLERLEWELNSLENKIEELQSRIDEYD